MPSYFKRIEVGADYISHMAGLQSGAQNNNLKQLRLALKVAAQNWLLLLLLEWFEKQKHVLATHIYGVYAFLCNLRCYLHIVFRRR